MAIKYIGFVLHEITKRRLGVAVVSCLDDIMHIAFRYNLRADFTQFYLFEFC